ncbi:Polymyxin resistance protein [Fimbriiglobus ruber]|uniref:Polymyxin resistance protein n=2 Tax=Fimbriiglobus ruber TaxID=1908690 RepID=A0A225D0J3_9BACT|nr:Polymyxin resistance protein [Fimbriiglobus ruber]
MPDDNLTRPVEIPDRKPGICSAEFVAACAVLVAAAVLFGGRLGDRGVVSEELRWAEVAREMRQTGNFFQPTINGQTYYDKPVGSYWLIVAASYLTGEVDETAARLPAAVAGWVGVLLVMCLGARLYDARTGVFAGTVLATCFGFAFYARRATADVETVTGVLAAVWLFARHRDRPQGPWVLLLWLVMAVTSLTKGLLGFVLPLAVLGVYGLLVSVPRDRGRVAGFAERYRWFFNWWSLVAVPLAVAVYFAPFLLSERQSGSADGLDMVFRENVRRFYAPHNHTGSVYLYVGVIFVLAAPWSAFLLAALLPGKQKSDGDRLARAYFWAVFVFFTLASSRRSYYLLPVLPAVALLVARVLTAPVDELLPLARRLRVVGYVLFGCVVVGAGVLLLPPANLLPAPYDHLPDLPARWAYATGCVASPIAFGWSVVRARHRLPAVVAAITFAGLAYALLVALPAADEFRTRRTFAAEVRARVADAPDHLALYHARDIAFDLNHPVRLHEYTAPDELTAALRAGTVRWVIARRRYLAGLTLPAAVQFEEKAYPWDGTDQLGDKMVLLEATGSHER